MKILKNLLYLILFMAAIFAEGKEKYGLVLITHGSPDKNWTKNAHDIENAIIEALKREGIESFGSVKIAMMEFAKPTINETIREIEKLGIKKVYAIPLFIAPSDHSIFDIPAILGLASCDEMVKNLGEEKIDIVKSDIHITLGPSLDYGDVIEKIMLDRVKEISVNSQKERLVLLAHGSPMFEPIWVQLMTRIGSYIAAVTGIKKVEYAFIEVGQSFNQEGLPLILDSEEDETTLVAGVYLSMNLEKLWKISMKNKDMFTPEIKNTDKIKFTNKGLLPHPEIYNWIIARAKEWLNNK